MEPGIMLYTVRGAASPWFTGARAQTLRMVKVGLATGVRLL